jgi:hypothetical protein
LRPFQSSTAIKDKFTFLFQITKEKFSVQKQDIMIEYTDASYEQRFDRHQALNRRDSIEQSIQDYKKEL